MWNSLFRLLTSTLQRCTLPIVRRVAPPRHGASTTASHSMALTLADSSIIHCPIVLLLHCRLATATIVVPTLPSVFIRRYGRYGGPTSSLPTKSRTIDLVVRSRTRLSLLRCTYTIGRGCWCTTPLILRPHGTVPMRASHVLRELMYTVGTRSMPMGTSRMGSVR